MSFRNFDEAFKWALVHGRENCRPCDRWQVEKTGEVYKIAIRFTSGKFVGYAI